MNEPGYDEDPGDIDIEPQMPVDVSRLPQYSYDNEWIKYWARLAENPSTKTLAQFVIDNDKLGEWSSRQKITMKTYTDIILTDLLSTTIFRTARDLAVMKNNKALIDCDLSLELTVFDMTPKYNIFLGMIDYLVNIASQRSTGGFFTKRMGAQRQEIMLDERHRERGTGFKDKIENRMGLNE